MAAAVGPLWLPALCVLCALVILFVLGRNSSEGSKGLRRTSRWSKLMVRGHVRVHPGGHTRRQLLKATLGGAAGLVLGCAHSTACGSGHSCNAAAERLADDLFVLRIPGETNVVAHVGADGVVLVDGVSAGATDALMKAVAALPGGGPVHTLFNTHWHPEQTGSNELLGKAGQDDHRAREHAAVADDRRHLAVERPAVQAPAEGRAAEQDLLHDRPARARPSDTATSPTRRTPTATCTSTSRSRTCWRWAT